MAHHSLAHPTESQAALDALIAKYGHAAAYQIATVYAWRGEKQATFDWLERARVQRDAGLTMVKVDPLLRSVRDDPRYAEFLRKMKLPPD